MKKGIATPQELRILSKGFAQVRVKRGFEWVSLKEIYGRGQWMTEQFGTIGIFIRPGDRYDFILKEYYLNLPKEDYDDIKAVIDEIATRQYKKYLFRLK